LHETIKVFLSVLNRRGIPLPSAVYAYFTKVDGRTHDSGDEKFLEEFIVPKADQILIDVGASIGDWSLFVAEKGKTVYAFEPSPKSFRVLLERTKEYPNIHSFSYALGETDTMGRIGLAAFSLSGTMDEEIKGLHKGGTIDVVVRSLDSLNLLNIGVIKIDTEGYETPILMGAIKTINREKPLLIIEIHRATGKALPTFTNELQRISFILRDLGYTWITRYRYVGLRETQPFLIAEPKVANPQ
jgi:FkbM family methyltransferase